LPLTTGGTVTVYKAIKVGKPLKVDDFKGRPAPPDVSQARGTWNSQKVVQ
jgi:hypothetical protein